MKLGKLGIFFILLLSLLFGGLGYSTYELMSNRKEGYENNEDSTETPDQVNSYNNSTNQNNSTYDYVSSTPTSLDISDDQSTQNNSNATPTSSDITVNGASSSDSSSSSSSSGNGDEYILKSQIVPPVCPKCPDAASCPRPKPCPPCAPCARCPEPAFECKKVPSYQGGPYPNMPKPVLNDFSQFGM